MSRHVLFDEDTFPYMNLVFKPVLSPSMSQHTHTPVIPLVTHTNIVVSQPQLYPSLSLSQTLHSSSSSVSSKSSTPRAPEFFNEPTRASESLNVPTSALELA